MSPIKFSLRGPGDDREETVELDDDDSWVSSARSSTPPPDLTMTEAVRQGIKHVVDTGRSGADGLGEPQTRLQLRTQTADGATPQRPRLPRGMPSSRLRAS